MEGRLIEMDVWKELQDNKISKYGDEVGFALSNYNSLYVEVMRDEQDRDYYFIEYNEITEEGYDELLESISIMVEDKRAEEKIKKFISEQEDKYRPREMSEADYHYKYFVEPHLILPRNY